MDLGEEVGTGKNGGQDVLYERRIFKKTEKEYTRKMRPGSLKVSAVVGG